MSTAGKTGKLGTQPEASPEPDSPANGRCAGVPRQAPAETVAGGTRPLRSPGAGHAWTGSADGGMWALLRFSWPILLELMLQFVVGLLLFSTLGAFSDAAAAGVGVAGSVIGLLQMMALSLSQAGAVLIARALGAGDAARAGAMARWLLGLVVAVATASMLAVLHGETTLLVRVMNLPGAAAQHGIDFFRIARWSLAVHALVQFLVAMLRGHGNTVAPLRATLIAQAVHLSGILYLRFSGPLSWLGVPQFVACSALLGSLISVLFLLREVAVGAPGRLLFAAMASADRGRAETVVSGGADTGIAKRSAGRELLWLTLLIACEPVAYQLAQLGLSRILSHFGEGALAARAYVGCLSGVTPLVAIALGWGAQVKVGYLLGTRSTEVARHTVLQGCRFSLVFCPLCACTLYLLGPWIMPLFSHDPDILFVSQMLLGVQVLLEMGRSCNCVVAPSLKAAGDGLVVAQMSVLSMLILSLPLAWLLSLHLQLGVLGTALVSAFDELLRGVFNVHRWRTLAG